MKRLLTALLLIAAFAGTSHALPALQLGPGAGTWTYDTGTQTWVTDTNPFSLFAYANATSGSGAYAWDAAGAGTQTAYFVVSAVPMVVGDHFDVSVVGDGGALTLVSSGTGAPPINDPNDLAPHSIFDTYFEVYEFQFTPTIVLISDTQPPGGGSSDGYAEEITVTINSLTALVTGVHMDLFTLADTGILDAINDGSANDFVKRFAPFSHDAEFIPEPGSLLLLSLGMVGVGIVRRRRK